MVCCYLECAHEHRASGEIKLRKHLSSSRILSSNSRNDLSAGSRARSLMETLSNSSPVSSAFILLYSLRSRTIIRQQASVELKNVCCTIQISKPNTTFASTSCFYEKSKRQQEKKTSGRSDHNTPQVPWAADRGRTQLVHSTSLVVAG